MRLQKVLAVVNALAAAVVLVVTAVVTDVRGMAITPSAVVAASEQTDPAVGLQLLSRGVAQSQDRANVLKWLCRGTLPILTANALLWATQRHGARDVGRSDDGGGAI